MNEQRGFSMLEVVVAAFLFSAMLGSVAIVLARDNTATRVLTAQIGPEMNAHYALERMVRELRTAGVRGEDRNGNGKLDAHEDFNSNYLFDAHWDLEDGVENQTHLTFNRRVATLSSAEDLAPTTFYSEAIVYSLENGRIVRTVRRAQPGTTIIEEAKTVLASGVRGLHFSRDGYVVTIRLEVDLPESVYDGRPRVLTERVLLRN